MNRLGIKRLLGQAYRGLRPRKSPRRIILLYHAIGDGPWDVTQADFAEQMHFLAIATTQASMDSLLKGKSEETQVAITFDDGYDSLVDVALPIMEAMGLRATVFLSLAHIGAVRERSNPELGHYPDKTFLCWSDVEKLKCAGWQIESHGLHHVDYTTESVHYIVDELMQSRQVLLDKSGALPECFAYPWGRYNAKVQKVVADVGFRCAVSGIHQPVTPEADRFALPRVNVASDYNIDDFEAILRGDWDFLGLIQQLRGRIW